MSKALQVYNRAMGLARTAPGWVGRAVRYSGPLAAGVAAYEGVDTLTGGRFGNYVGKYAGKYVGKPIHRLAKWGQRKAGLRKPHHQPMDVVQAVDTPRTHTQLARPSKRPYMDVTSKLAEDVQKIAKFNPAQLQSARRSNRHSFGNIRIKTFTRKVPRRTRRTTKYRR